MPFLIYYDDLNRNAFFKLLQDRGFRLKPLGGGVYILDLPEDDSKENIIDQLAELDKHFLKHLKLSFIPSEDYIKTQTNLIRALINLKPFDKIIEEFTVFQRKEILDSLYAVFQPIVDLRHFEVFAFEALCRGKLPIYYLMKFAKPILETIDWTCREKALKKKKEEIPPPIKLFLNFFPESLQDVNLASEKLFGLLKKYNISPSEIVVEITEYAGFDVKKLKKLVEEWRNLGIMIALDDIGTGEDSLFRFLEIMPDIIKIDMVFIRGIHKNKVKRDITRYLINLAHANNMLVVAEGVEEPDELRVVYDLGADLVQGWLLGKPTENPKSFLYTPIASKLRQWI
ncbi:MAG TPA: EAL domain-containing protein [Aquificales bacterium]|nr:EAL domain-containing protein [Aquificales bacterium]